MNHRLSNPILVVFCLCLGLGVLLPGALAVSTRFFLLDDAESLSEGEMEGAAVNSDGSVTAGVETRRLALEKVPVAFSLLRGEGDTAYVGTGNKGEIYRLKGNELRSFVSTGQLLVASLAFGHGNKLFAGTLPKGKIFVIDDKGKAKVFAEPEGAEHIWSLVYDAKRKLLFAATGPAGKIFAIDARGKAELYYDADAAHVMSLALDRDGTLYAGTSDEALLLQLNGPGRAEVLHDFEGDEVTAIAVRDGRVAAAVNDFPRPRTPPERKSKKDDKDDEDKNRSTPKRSTPPKLPRSGKGKLWVVESSGRAEQLFKTDKEHLTAVQWKDDDSVYVASGREGRIYLVRTDGTSAVWIDVDERQVLALDLEGQHPLFVTADKGAVYRVVPGRARESLWTSKTLDAEFRARWGKLDWRGRGALSFQTRSGNTQKPDKSWSAWSAPLTRPGPIPSPASRFLQIRSRLGSEADTAIYAVLAYYLPQNQRATVQDITIKPKEASSKSRRSTSSSRKRGGKKADFRQLPDDPTTVYRIEWKVDNPDDDELRYRLQFRAEGQKVWREMLKEHEKLTKSQYDWDTVGVPDGFYRVRVRTSDELANPGSYTVQTSALSEPFLVDNHPPQVRGLKWAGRTLRGTARDATGPIAKLEYAVDGGDWMIFFPLDDLFDSAEERFELKLDDLEKGEHIVSVRATDAAGNTASAEITVR